MMLVLGAMAQEARAANPSEELEALLSGIAAGSREDLAELYRRTRAAVYGLALSYLKNGAEAEDVAQDTFVKVWAAAPSYRPQGKPMAWLLTIARNLALGRLRTAARIQDLSEAQWSAFSIESDTLTADDRTVLGAALGRLSDEERHIVVLHAVCGLKHREIAQFLDLALPTVLSKYHRSLKKLKTILEGDDAQ
ncbi:MULTISPECIES: RNA polymerase sigma factor [Eubacteriales]|uniref:RNA polymerase sigma factor n=1 Tax=Eubacteriales TaxID=186802 RepID=UPI000B375F06|nr:MULTISPECIES: RNA polymerase sigma factor [Eubacteriales]MDY4166338.1 RNA polymerase sigma factor [Fournierella sp.]OUP25479.1 RNA polymerase subunit sigma [Gemmiger sp. An194]